MTEKLCCKTIGVFGDSSCERLAELVHCRNCPEYARAGRRLFDRLQSREEREQWTELLSCEKEIEPEGTVSAVVFKVGSEWFALKTAFLQEITDSRPVHSVPYRSGGSFKGLANINGELLLCVDPAAAMGLEAEPAALRRMIVAVRDGQRYALMVPDIRGVHRIAPGAISNPPATVAKNPSALTTGLFALDDIQIGLLDEKLFFEALAGSIAS